MKKVLLVAAVLALGTSALSAQKVQHWFLGGNVTAAAQQYDGNYNAANFNVAPQVGYMFNSNWGIALNLNYGLSRENKVNDVVMGGGLSGLYVMKITDKFMYTPALNLGYGMGYTEYKDADNKKVKESEYTVMGGSLDFLKFEFRPSCHWGITAGFGSLYVKSSKPDETGAKSTLTGGLNLTDTTVGFKYYF
jgi:opacity protein-like surface antigen